MTHADINKHMKFIHWFLDLVLRAKLPFLKSELRQALINKGIYQN